MHPIFTRLGRLNLEKLWLIWVVFTVFWSLLGVALAQVGEFRPLLVGVATILACLGGWLFGYIERRNRELDRKGDLWPTVLLLIAGGLLFGWPAEHFPLLGDSAIYLNTAAMLARTGGLVYHYDPLNGLSLEQKQLFYIPSDRQLPYIQIHSYQGLLYGAYYVMDPDQNIVVSSRPPLAIVWMALFKLVFGTRGMLYVMPIFGTVSLVALYFLGKRLFGPVPGTLSALWLLVSFPQLHFSRTPYAEVMGQFFILASLYAFVTYLQTHRLKFIPLGFAALATAFTARIDAAIALSTILILMYILAIERDWHGIVISALSLGLMAGFSLWTFNRPYVGATIELLLAGQMRFLNQPNTRLVLLLAGFGCFTGLFMLRLLLRRINLTNLITIIRWGFSLSVLLGVGYALYIRPLAPEIVTVGEQVFRTYNEELMAEAARYMSPLFFWLAALGLVILLGQKNIRHEHILFIVFVLSFSTIFFWQYTTARVYPVALRRLVPEVLPGLSLLAAFALSWLGKQRRWRWGAVTLASLLAVLLIKVAGPYWFYREAVGTWDFLNTLARLLPSNAVILFEPYQNESVARWFAAPLWSFYGHQALILNSNDIDKESFQGALCYWESIGKEIHVVSQQEPGKWWPGEFQGYAKEKVNWNSSIIGQSRMFPPYVWRFIFTFQIYQYKPNCPSVRSSSLEHRDAAPFVQVRLLPACALAFARRWQ